MKKFYIWILVPSALAILGSAATEANMMHDAGMFISSATVFALVAWISFLALCATGVGRILK